MPTMLLWNLQAATFRSAVSFLNSEKSHFHRLRGARDRKNRFFLYLLPKFAFTSSMVEVNFTASVLVKLRHKVQEKSQHFLYSSFSVKRYLLYYVYLSYWFIVTFTMKFIYDSFYQPNRYVISNIKLFSWSWT